MLVACNCLNWAFQLRAQTRHILPLTGIRIFAAAWVVLYHFQGYLTPLVPGLSVIGPFAAQGYQAVPLFFLLSGFILSHNYFSNYSLAEHPRFIFLRFARLWPVHIVTLAVAVAGPDAFRLTGPLYRSLAEEALMVRSWFHADLAWNYPAWSVSVEWFAYIFVFPIAFVLFRRIQSGVVLGAMVAVLLAGQSFIPGAIFPGRCGSIIFLFLAGCGLYRMYSVIRNPPAGAIALFGVLLLAAYIFFAGSLSVLVLYVAFAVLIYGLAYERGWIARFLSTKFMVRGGLMSYSLYLTHVLILRNYQFYFWQRIPHAAGWRFAILLLLIAALAGTAAVFYLCIEEPANRLLRQSIPKGALARNKESAAQPAPGQN